jgi:hypothetical protein
MGALKNQTFTLVGYSVEIGDKNAQLVIRERCSTTSYLKNFQSRSWSFRFLNP